MSENETGELFSLVNISNLEQTSFLKRAPIREILLWSKLFGIEGKVTKRLDLIFDLETLNYLYWNTTQQPPEGTVDEMVAKCAELSTKLAIDETSAEELQSRIPPELLQTASTTEGANTMGQGGTDKDLSKGGTAAPADGVDKAAEKAAAKAEKERLKAEAKAKKDAEKAEAKAKREADKQAKAEARAAAKASGGEKLSVDRDVIKTAFDAVTNRAEAEAKVQTAFQAIVPAKNGSRASDPKSYGVDVTIQQNAEAPAGPVRVSVMWFASVVSGLKTAQFYRRDAIGLAQKLGLTVFENGQPIAVKPPKEEAAPTQPAAGGQTATA